MISPQTSQFRLTQISLTRCVCSEFLYVDHIHNGKNRERTGCVSCSAFLENLKTTNKQLYYSAESQRTTLGVRTQPQPDGQKSVSRSWCWQIIH